MIQILRNLTRRKLRSFLTISGIVIGIFALTTMGAMAEHFNALLDGGVKYYGSNIQVGADTSGAFGGSLLPLSKEAEIRAVDGVDAVYPGIQVNAKPGGTNVVSFGIPDYLMTMLPDRPDAPIRVTFASGRTVSETRDGEVVLGSSFAQEFKKKVGDSIALPVRPQDAKPDFVQRTFTVVGVLNETRTAPDSGAFLNLHDSQTLLAGQLPATLRASVDPHQLATFFIVYGRPGENLDKLADRITAEVSGVKATRPTDLVQSFKTGGALFTVITTGAALLALVIGGLSVVNTMIMAVTERVREIGLKKAVGAHTWQVMVEFLAEAVVIGLLGGVVGFALGVAATYVGNATASSQATELFLVTPTLAALSLGFAVGMGAVAGVIPALRAARLDPVTALRMT